MSRVRDWFLDFQGRLIQRSGRADFPHPASEFWENFERSLRRCGASEAQADEASSVVCETPDLFVSQFLPLVIAEVKKLQALALAEGRGVTLGGIEAAKLVSGECRECSGMGFAIRYVHEDIQGLFRTANGGSYPIGAKVSIACACPFGQQIAMSAGRDSRALPTRHAYPLLAHSKYSYHPDRWDDEHGEPLPPQNPIRTLADLRRLTMAPGIDRRPVVDHSVLRAIESTLIRERPPEATPGPFPIAATQPEQPEPMPDDGLYGWF